MINEIFNLQNPWRKQINYIFNLKERNILPILIKNLENDKIIGLIGSRQVGKSSLLFCLIQHLIHKKNINPENIFYFNLDDIKLRELFSNIKLFLEFIGELENKKYIFIDEVQRLENPGLFLKEIYDLKLNIKIIYSGSSQLEIKAKLKENLVGRSRVFIIHRLSFPEFIDFNKPILKKDALSEILIYGSYPTISLESNHLEKKLLIKDIYQSYIEKDLVDFLKVDNINAFNKMLVILANQVGSLSNIHNISRTVAISVKEIEKYIMILENTFIIKRVYPFYNNYKKEITKTPKIYFLDLGLRNYLINNFNNLDLRNDAGLLFENFYFLELLYNDFYSMKKINYWRTQNQTGIDFIVQDEDKKEALEVKWKSQSAPKSFITFKKYYPDFNTKIINSNSFLEKK